MDKKLNTLKAEYWKKVLRSCNQARQDSGISKAEWCAQNGIGIKSLYRWQRALRLEAADQLLPAKQEIVPVQIARPEQILRQTGSSEEANSGKIILETGSITLCLPAAIPVEYLLTLIHGLS